MTKENRKYWQMKMGTWKRYEPGTWLPRDNNEFCDCPLYEITYRNIKIEAHKTKDGKRWIAKARTLAPLIKISVPYGGGKRTRLASFWDAVSRCNAALSSRSRLAS